MTSRIWTPERTRQLMTLWKEGRTAAWIARALGPGVSRCAVLGKVYRLGLARGPEARRVRTVFTSLQTKPPRKAVSIDRLASRPCAASKSKAGVAPSAAATETPSGPTATVLSVGFGQCRWPYGVPGEAGFGLCGRSVARGAFCAAHAAVGYQDRPISAESLLRMAGLG